MTNLLIVDDEKALREGLAGYIRRTTSFFSQVLTAKSGTAALACFETQPIAAALIDINLGDFNGLDLIALLNKRYPETLLVVISGYDDFEFVRKALTLKVHDYLLKPIPLSDLKNLLTELEQQLQTAPVPAQPAIASVQPLSQMAYDYIENNYFDRSISLQQTAQALFISTSQLNKLLKKDYQQTFSELLIRCRLQKAKELLSQTNLHYPIAEIAGKVGYDDPHYFSRLFRKKIGIPPIQYREQQLAPGKPKENEPD